MKMRPFLLSIAVQTLFGIIILYYLSYLNKIETAAEAFAAGWLLSILNLLVMLWGWRQILTKKSVALAVIVIVSKFAILLGLINYFVVHRQVSILWLATGLATTMISVVIVGLLQLKELKENNNGET